MGQGHVGWGRDSGDRLPRRLDAALPHIPTWHPGLGCSSPPHPARVGTTGECPCLPPPSLPSSPSHLFLPPSPPPQTCLCSRSVSSRSTRALSWASRSSCSCRSSSCCRARASLRLCSSAASCARSSCSRLWGGDLQQGGGQAQELVRREGSTHLSRSSCSRRSRSSRSRCSRAWRRFSASSRAASSRSMVPAGGLPGGVAGTGLGAAGAGECTQCQWCSHSPQPCCPPATQHPPAVGSTGTFGGSGRAGVAGPRSSSFLSRTFTWPSCSPRSPRALARTLGEE